MLEHVHTLIQLNFTMHCCNLRHFLLSTLQHSDRLEWIFLAILVLTVQKMTSKLVVAQLTVLTVAQQNNFLAGHAVELDIDSLPIVQLRVEDH